MIFFLIIKLLLRLIFDATFMMVIRSHTLSFAQHAPPDALNIVQFPRGIFFSFLVRFNRQIDQFYSWFVFILASKKPWMIIIRLVFTTLGWIVYFRDFFVIEILKSE